MSAAEYAEVMKDWPQPATGNFGPVLRYGHGPALLAYDTPDGKVAIVTLPVCLKVICGHPNDEVLHGHPLYGKGLSFNSVHQVRNSSRLVALERANAVHHRHDAASYLKDKAHWVFTFQDGTVEFLCLSSANFAVSFVVCNNWAEANALLGATEANSHVA